MQEQPTAGWSESPPVPTKLMRDASADLSRGTPEPMCHTIMKPAQAAVSELAQLQDANPQDDQPQGRLCSLSHEQAGTKQIQYARLPCCMQGAECGTSILAGGDPKSHDDIEGSDVPADQPAQLKCPAPEGLPVEVGACAPVPAVGSENEEPNAQPVRLPPAAGAA